MWLETAILASLGWILFKFCFDVYNYWEKKGVAFIKGSFPFGSKSTLSFLARYQGIVIQEYYNELSPHSFGGYFLYRKPILLVRDPEIIKHIMVKDFSNFRSRFGKINNKKEPLSLNLFSLEGDLWKSVRVKLTPTFTSGKLKMMYEFFDICSIEFLKALKKESNGLVDIKEAFARFTTDIIATCAFGLEADSINNPDTEFRKIGQQMFPGKISFRRKLATVLYNLFPSARKFLTFRVTPKNIEDFLMNMVKDTIEYREKNNVKRNDFLNLLLEIKNKNIPGDELDMDLPMIMAQCFVFFAAGFETSSSVQSYALHELAMNEEIQEKARIEIKQVLAKHDGKVTYQALQEMNYLEQVINESMRKYPTLPILTRVCSKNWRSPCGVEIDEGTMIQIPIYALHHDPKYFPNPEKFDPERFSEERKSSFPQYSYLPFGEGPRMCIGMRFGILQTKLGLVTILNNFQVLPCEKTKHPLNFVATTAISSIKDPIFVKLVETNKTY